MGVEPLGTAIAAAAPDAVPAALEPWEGAVDDVILRAVTAGDSVEEHLAQVRAAAPG
jgi:hypothetical protein